MNRALWAFNVWYQGICQTKSWLVNSLTKWKYQGSLFFLIYLRYLSWKHFYAIEHFQIRKCKCLQAWSVLQLLWDLRPYCPATWTLIVLHLSCLLRNEWNILLGLLAGILLAWADAGSGPYTVGISPRVDKTSDSTAVTCDLYTSVEDCTCCLFSWEPPPACAYGWELVADMGGGRGGWDGGSGHSSIPAR